MKLSEININRRSIFITLIIIASAYIIYISQDILFIVFLSFIIAYILNPVVELMGRLKINRTFSVAILTIFTLSIITLFVSIALPIAINDIIDFSKNLPTYISQLFANIESLLARFDITLSLDYIKPFIMDKIGLISKYTFDTITTAVSSIKGAVSIILNFILVPILVFFLLKDLPTFKAFIVNVLEVSKLEKIVKFAIEFESIIGRYFRGMFIVGMILSALYITVLLIIGVKQAVLLGILTGMGGMIPYLGFAIGIITTLIVTAIEFQDIIHLVYVIIGFSIVQFMESFLITPKIVGDSLGLSPVLVIIALMIGGSVLGLFGIILALPVAAFTKIMIYRYILKRPIKNS